MNFSLLCIIHLLMLPLCVQESESSQRIKHNTNETAILGENVTLFCNFTSLANVEQITWQKIRGSLPQNIGTYSRKYGEKILPPYVNRLQCKILEPSASFMTIQGVTFEDEACYKCLFNIFPQGSHGGQTCLTILTVSELVTELQSAPGSEDLHNLQCSAVGKPAPRISIYPSQVTVNPPQEYFAQNANATVTVTKIYNISLKTVRSLGLRDLVVSMTHPVRYEEKIVPLPVNQTSTTNPCLSWKITATVFILLFLISWIIFGAILYIHFKKKRSENTPEPSSTQMPNPLSTLVPTPPSTETENLMRHRRQTET
ncbi:OX-2 membrane glycoprotein-like [Arvicanthis niloticus]|uniref:OX-2 membrane glycoprotein-like n=1 Tax=Arvicanthis niloticus TaxID=61156 RepID=UPI001487107D|nr:OX-2 membrane glycoprotein-like [Arvicanthis niloticus]